MLHTDYYSDQNIDPPAGTTNPFIEIEQVLIIEVTSICAYNLHKTSLAQVKSLLSPKVKG